MANSRISEFESHHPRHAVGLCGVSRRGPFAVYARDFIGQPVGGRIVEGASGQVAEAVAVRKFQLTDDHGGALGMA